MCSNLSSSPNSFPILLNIKVTKHKMSSLTEVVQSEEMFLFVLFQLSLCLFNSPFFHIQQLKECLLIKSHFISSGFNYMRHCTSFCGCLAFNYVNHYRHGKNSFFNLYCCKGSKALLNIFQKRSYNVSMTNLRKKLQ